MVVLIVDDMKIYLSFSGMWWTDFEGAKWWAVVQIAGRGLPLQKIRREKQK